MGFRWGLPDNIATYGDSIDRLNIVMHWFMLALFVGWGAWMAMCLWKFRARPGHRATYEPIHATPSKWLEIGVAVFEGILLVGFSMPMWTSFKKEFPVLGKSTEVHIVAQQFAWNFHYAGKDGKFGSRAPRFTDNSNPLGIDPGDPAGKDDVVTVNTLHYPADKPVVATISSKDVIHSFGVPALRLKQDAIPGMSIPIWWESQPKVIENLMLTGGGTNRHVLWPSAPGAAKANLALTATGADVKVAISTGAGYTAAGDILWIRPESALAAGGKNVGGYRVTSVEGDGNTISATKLEGSAETVASIASAHQHDIVVRTDEFDIACSQLCGISHTKMRAVLKPETEAEFEAFLAEYAPAAAEAPVPVPMTTGTNR